METKQCAKLAITYGSSIYIYIYTYHLYLYLINCIKLVVDQLPYLFYICDSQTVHCFKFRHAIIADIPRKLPFLS